MKEPFGRQEEKKGHVMSWESKQNSASRRVAGNKIRKWFNMERIMKERQRENNESPLKDMKQDFNQYNNKYIIGLPILNRKYWYRKDVHSSQISLYFKKLKKNFGHITWHAGSQSTIRGWIAPPAVEAQSLNHWATREVLLDQSLIQGNPNKHISLKLMGI